MITLTKKKWTEILSDDCGGIKDNELLKAISSIYRNLDETECYAYHVEIGFGDFIIENGIINSDLLSASGISEFKNDISYSKDPLALVVKNQIEVFTLNRCSNRTRVIKEFDSGNKKGHIVNENEYVVPLNTIKEGDFYGVFGTLDYLANVTQIDHGMDWYAVSGLISFQFDFPFFHSQIKSGIKDDYKDFFRQHKDQYNSEYFPGKEQLDLIKTILPDFKTIVIYFPKHIFEIQKESLKKELHLQILEKGWLQCVPLRHNSFVNKVLSDISKHFSLNNNTEFILRLYDYLTNVTRYKALVLRPLIDGDSHFLIEAIEKFQLECNNYFSDEKKNIKPVIYIYDAPQQGNFGILSMTNLPILKNYNYTKVNDVIKDLITISKEFKRRNIENYILDVENVDGYGQLDRSGKDSGMIINGTEEFRELISKITGINSDSLITTYGHFSNAIAIKNE